MIDRIVASIDRDAFADIAERYRDSEAAKYLDLPRWIGINLRRVQRLRIDRGRRRRVIDLGCGAGYFLYICKLLGHDVLGVDVPNVGMYSELTALLGVPVLAHCIEPFQPLPITGHWDVMTAHMVTFNGHCVSPWGAAEWRYLLDDVKARWVALELNREPDGSLFSDGLRELFVQRGAVLQDHVVVLDRERPARSLR